MKVDLLILILTFWVGMSFALKSVKLGFWITAIAFGGLALWFWVIIAVHELVSR